DNDLVLERDPMLKGAWYRNVESWRNGRVYQNCSVVIPGLTSFRACCHSGPGPQYCGPGSRNRSCHALLGSGAGGEGGEFLSGRVFACKSAAVKSTACGLSGCATYADQGLIECSFH